MDLRKWLLLNDLPHASSLTEDVRHIPCSEWRSANILRLFAAGRQCGFMLSDAEGQPTEALRVMVSMMPGAQLCLVHDLPPEERKAFGKEGHELIKVLDRSWYIRGITERFKIANAHTAMPAWQDKWQYDFLPGVDGAYITYLDGDGKRRKRVCYIAVCPTNWKLHDVVYGGLFRWNYEHREDGGAYGYFPARRPDGYGILDENPDLRTAGDEGARGGPPEATGATA